MWGYPFFKLWFVILWFLDHSSLFTSHFSLLTFHFSLLYQALQCFMKFQVNSEGITLQTEMTARRHRFEIRSEATVLLTGDRDELAVEHARITLRCPRPRLDERVVRIGGEILIHVALRIQAQHALIVLTLFHSAVAAQDGFQVTAQVCVSVPNFLIVLFHFYKRFGKDLGLTRGSLPHNRGSETGLRSIAWPFSPSSVGAAKLRKRA